MILNTNITGLRDPYVLLDNGVYYVYGTDTSECDSEFKNTKWSCYKNTTGKLDGEWKKIDKEIAINPPNAEKNRWAPEVYKYNGAYYMFATYYSSSCKHRGCKVIIFSI